MDIYNKTIFLKEEKLAVKNPNYNEGDLKDHHAISALIKNENNEILMLKHNKFGFWTIPVGKVDEGDSIEESLHREVFEETNIKILEAHEITSFTRKYLRGGKMVNVIAHIFEVTKWTGKAKNKEPQKHAELTWMSVEEIRREKYISDSTIEILKIKTL